MAIPGIIQQLARSSPMMGQIKQMMNMVSGAQDPMGMLRQLMDRNPQMKQVMDVISNAGGDPRQAFYALAQQKGVDPQEILNMMK